MWVVIDTMSPVPGNETRSQSLFVVTRCTPAVPPFGLSSITNFYALGFFSAKRHFKPYLAGSLSEGCESNGWPVLGT